MPYTEPCSSGGRHTLTLRDKTHAVTENGTLLCVVSFPLGANVFLELIMQSIKNAVELDRLVSMGVDEMERD